MIAIIQARNSSKRLPNKSMLYYKKISVLERVINCVKRSKSIKKIIVATSKKKNDNTIVALCKKKNINIYRGSLKNVSSRFYNILKLYNSKYFLRVCADSPFLDYKLIDISIKKIYKKKIDIVTNVFPRTFPTGQSVELVKTKTFLRNYKYISSSSEKEHVTKFFYNNYKKYTILNFKNKKNYSNCGLSLDHKNDLIKYKKIINLTNDKYYGWKKLIKIN